MTQLAVMLLSFLAIPILGKFKISLGLSLIVTATLMAILNGFGLLDLINIFTGVFRNSSSLNTILVVAAISVVGAMMKEYGILDKVISALSELVNDKRILLVVVPALIGTLVIPGGAILSAPFAFSLGHEMDMPRPRRAAANLLFRHMAVFLLPYSTSLMVAMSITNFSASELISANIFGALSMIITGYFVILKKAPSLKDSSPKKRRTLHNIKQILIYATPMYICVVIHITFGIPLYICMLASLVALYILGPKKGFFELLYKYIGYKTVVSIIGVYMIQGVVTNLSELNAIFQNIFELGPLVLPALAFTSLFFGIITGLHMSALSIVLPMLLSLGLERGELLAYVYFAFCWSFLGYFFSPLHMCQIFTCQYMEISLKDLFKEYLPAMAILSVLIFITYFGLSHALPIIYI